MSAIEMGGGWHFHLKGRKSGKFGGVLVLQQLYGALLVLQQYRHRICQPGQVGIIMLIYSILVCPWNIILHLSKLDFDPALLIISHFLIIKHILFNWHLFVKELLLNFLQAELSHPHLLPPKFHTKPADAALNKIKNCNLSLEKPRDRLWTAIQRTLYCQIFMHDHDVPAFIFAP